MKISKKYFFNYFILITFTLLLVSCATKKNTIVINNEVISKNYTDHKSKSNILYLIDGKEVTENFIKTLETHKIESLTVFKGDKEVAKYTDKKYDGVIISKLKK